MLPPGTMIGGYRIVRKVADGGMSIVYEAVQVSLKRPVALKVLSKDLADDSGAFRERFERESEIQAELDHPHIVTIYEADDSEYGLWLAMRLVRGRTLAEALGAGEAEPALAWQALAPIADALDVAHERGLIHRDITPRNILIDERGHPYLADFGITKRRGDRSLTGRGEFIGTIEYVAPEQIKDEPAGSATDVYSLSAILFECLTGRVPFDKDSEMAIMYAHLEEPPPRASLVDPTLPRALDEVLEKGLAKAPRDRYQAAGELIAAARSACSRGELPGPSKGADRDADAALGPAERLPRSRVRTAVIAFLATLALLAGGFGAGALAEGGSSRRQPSAAAGSLAVSVPSGWEAHEGRSSGIPGLPLVDPLILTPRNEAGQAAVVGMSLARGKNLLPATLRTGRDDLRGTPVSLGSLQALRYLGLQTSSHADPLTMLVSPTSNGVATVACGPARPGAELSRVCQRLATSLKLVHGKGYPLGPSPAVAKVLQRQIGKLNRRQRKLRRRLARASGTRQQADAAADSAKAFRQCAEVLASVPVTPQSAVALGDLVDALRSTGETYKQLKVAAQVKSPGVFRIATDEISLAETIVADRLRALRHLGYRVGPAS